MNFSSIPFVASATPGGPPPGAVEWVSNTAPATSPESTDHSLPLSASGAVGDFLLMLKHNWNIPVSALTDPTTQALTQLAAYPTAGSGENGQMYGVQLAGSVPTAIDVVVSPAGDIGYMNALARGVSAQGGSATYEHITTGPITSLPYTATVASSLIALIVSHHPDTRITAATFNGGAGLVIEGWAPDFDLILGVHDGSTGANNVAITTNVPSSEMRMSAVELVP